VTVQQVSFLSGHRDLPGTTKKRQVNLHPWYFNGKKKAVSRNKSYVDNGGLAMLLEYIGMPPLTVNPNL